MTAFRILLALALLQLVTASPVAAACYPIPIEDYSPTGIAGCEVWGVGTASMWGGPGAARNDCVWPWTDCQTISIRSLDTGRVIVVTPTMYCDCYTGTDHQRIVDLDRSMVLALGLDPDLGLWQVEVLAADAPVIPDTAMSAE